LPAAGAVKHILVTNDFPPKVGGIQSYLWELWRRLPPDEVTVLATDHPGAAEFDVAQPFRMERHRGPVLVPTPALGRRIDELATEVDASLVVLDPALPLGLVGPRLRLPYAVVLHGAELVVPARLPPLRSGLRRVVEGAALAIVGGSYVATEVGRLTPAPPPSVNVPPGVDVNRFQPLEPGRRLEIRQELGVAADARLVLGVARLVPRKGMDVLVRAAGRLAPAYPDLTVVVAGTGRQAGALARLVARHRAPVRLLGSVPGASLPGLYGAADVFCMPCRNRWVGLEQEGFGIVFLEAAAAGVPAVAGRSGGTPEAVLDGETGLVVERPGDEVAVADALAALLDDPDGRARMGAAARRRAVEEYEYDVLAARLRTALAGAGS
jgi:phosphatidylinositol alpha-1,6-mannosyltransferase